MVVVVPQILNDFRASDALSLLVLGQYCLALPLTLGYVSLALYLVQGM